MKKSILILALLFTTLTAWSNDFKKQEIELDDAPIQIAEDLKDHKVKSIVHYIDQVGNQSYYVVISKYAKKHYKSVYSSIGTFESRNRRYFVVPVLVLGVIVTVGILSFSEL